VGGKEFSDRPAAVKPPQAVYISAGFENYFAVQEFKGFRYGDMLVFEFEKADFLGS
jgi:hypothetical protein